MVCPQNAKVVRNDVEKVKVMLANRQEEPVAVSLAPSFVANYEGLSITAMQAALKMLGFALVEETALGATLVKEQYDQLLESGNVNVLISSCCHTVNLLVRRHFPEALSYLARVVTPMQAHCQSIKQRYPNYRTVFIGPCISKKAEASQPDSAVDCVLTFEELSGWLKEEGIELKNVADSMPQSKARLFPTCGGIIKTMRCSSSDYGYLAIDGIDNCINALNDIIGGKIQKCFVEMSACSGSCIGGPVIEKSRRTLVSDYLTVSRYAGKSDFVTPGVKAEELRCDHQYDVANAVEPTEAEIREVLRKMGKNQPSDELNCGSCGYDTCRDKAVAVIRGKADLTMCLPFLKDRAESFSGNIIDNSPNGILVLNESLEVQQINEAALQLMSIRAASDVLGEQVIRIMEPKMFQKVLETGESVYHYRSYLADYAKYVDQAIMYDKGCHQVICIMRDVTEEESQREQRERICRHTVEITDQVVEKQMRVVQEIASLLGETTAETKIALSKLKESLIDESSLH